MSPVHRQRTASYSAHARKAETFCITELVQDPERAAGTQRNGMETMFAKQKTHPVSHLPISTTGLMGKKS